MRRPEGLRDWLWAGMATRLFVLVGLGNRVIFGINWPVDGTNSWLITWGGEAAGRKRRRRSSGVAPALRRTSGKGRYLRLLRRTSGKGLTLPPGPAFMA